MNSFPIPLWLLGLALVVTGLVWALDGLAWRHARRASGRPGEPFAITACRWLFLLALVPAILLSIRDMDFELALTVATVGTGAVWLLDVLIFRPYRRRLAAEDAEEEPALVEYARSFFPIILLVLLVRSFLFEPFRIPSSSMMPTLIEGDFIFVNKYSYGLKLPVLRIELVDLGEPDRGDVVVFKLPSDPSTNYIKRVVGLPGDRISYHEKRLTINGHPVDLSLDGTWDGHGEQGVRLGTEKLGRVKHHVLLRPWPNPMAEGEWVVPKGHYFMMGDNRDNSRDSRFTGAVGFVPEANLVGKAVRIWMNWSGGGPDWERIGNRIT